MQESFMLTVSSGAWLTHYPGNIISKFSHCLESPMDLRSGYDVALTEMIILPPKSEVGTENPCIVLCSLVNPQRTLTSYEPTVRLTWMKTQQLPTLIYLPCIKSVFYEINFEIGFIVAQDIKIETNTQSSILLNFHFKKSIAS
jgi:hypothetical protein